MRRHARNVDPTTNWLWILTASATVASIVSSTRKRDGLITPPGFASSASRMASRSAPWVISLPTIPGMGTTVGTEKNARTLAKRAAQAGIGPRSSARRRARPGTPRSTVRATTLTEVRTSVSNSTSQRQVLATCFEAAGMAAIHQARLLASPGPGRLAYRLVGIDQDPRPPTTRRLYRYAVVRRIAGPARRHEPSLRPS